MASKPSMYREKSSGFSSSVPKQLAVEAMRTPRNHCVRTVQGKAIDWGLLRGNQSPWGRADPESAKATVCTGRLRRSKARIAARETPKLQTRHTLEAKRQVTQEHRFATTMIVKHEQQPNACFAALVQLRRRRILRPTDWPSPNRSKPDSS